MEFDFSRNYFELFGLDPVFEVDIEKLSKNYQRLQSEYHPDRFVNENDQNRRLAMQVTTFINEGYEILLDEHARARYLLQMQKVPFNSEQDTTQDMEFLMAQMQLREQIDEVDKNENSLDRLDELASQARQQKNSLIEDYQRYYAAGQWDQAKEMVIKLQFFNRLQQQIKSKQEQLEDEML